jgi:hypothetical protein
MKFKDYMNEGKEKTQIRRYPWDDENILKNNLDILNIEDEFEALAELRKRLNIDHATALKLRLKIKDYSLGPIKSGFQIRQEMKKAKKKAWNEYNKEFQKSKIN